MPLQYWSGPLALPHSKIEKSCFRRLYGSIALFHRKSCRQTIRNQRRKGAADQKPFAPIIPTVTCQSWWRFLGRNKNSMQILFTSSNQAWIANTITSGNFSHKTDRYPLQFSNCPKPVQSKKGAEVSNYKLGPDPWNPTKIPLRSVDVKLDLL